MEGASREMPRYQCHKKVWALKIAKLDYIKQREGGTIEDGGVVVRLHPADEGYAPFNLPAEYVAKHHPDPGGYYVAYDDGYKSFSPAKAFEEGYTRIGEGGAGALSIERDDTRDVVTIEGVHYAGDLFRQFGHAMPVGKRFRLADRADGVISIAMEDGPDAAA